MPPHRTVSSSSSKKRAEGAARSRSRTPEPIDPVKKPKLDPVSESVISDEIEAANRAFGADDESPATWSSAGQLVPSASVATDLVAVGPGTGFDLSQELAHRFGCNNVYWRDIDLRYRTLSAKKSGDSYQGTQFVSLSTQPWLNQFFGHQKLQGFHVLMPICALSSCHLLPYGTIDEVGSAFPLTDKTKAKVKLSIRPSAFNPFTQTADGSMDAVALEAFAWFGMELEARIKAAMDRGEGTAKAEWSSITMAKGDSTSIALHADYNLLRDPRAGDDSEQFQQLKDRTYTGGYTETLNKLCVSKYKLMNQALEAYRVTTQAERDAEGGAALLAPLTWEQQTMLQPNVDEVMLLVAVKALTKGDTYHAKAQLAGFIWFGPSKHYAGMKENTVAEKLRLVPPFPKAPTKEQLWARKEAKQERKNFDDLLTTLREERGNG